MFVLVSSVLCLCFCFKFPIFRISEFINVLSSSTYRFILLLLAARVCKFGFLEMIYCGSVNSGKDISHPHPQPSPTFVDRPFSCRITFCVGLASKPNEGLASPDISRSQRVSSATNSAGIKVPTKMNADEANGDRTLYVWEASLSVGHRPMNAAVEGGRLRRSIRSLLKY